MSVQRDWTYSTGTFNAGTSTVPPSVPTTKRFTSNGSSFANLATNKTAGAVTAEQSRSHRRVHRHHLTFNCQSKTIRRRRQLESHRLDVRLQRSTVLFDGLATQTLSAPPRSTRCAPSRPTPRSTHRRHNPNTPPTWWTLKMFAASTTNKRDLVFHL